MKLLTIICFLGASIGFGQSAIKQFQSGGKTGLINGKDTVIKAEFDAIKILPTSTTFGDILQTEYAAVQSNGKWTVIGISEDTEKNDLLVGFDDVFAVSEGMQLIYVKKGELYGVVNFDGETCVPFEYSAFEIQDAKQEEGVLQGDKDFFFKKKKSWYYISNFSFNAENKLEYTVSKK